MSALADQLRSGLSAPICLTWELTYGCNLSCVHCLSASGRRAADELGTTEARAVIDELSDLGVFYVNIGGGEPMIRADFVDLVEHAVGRGIGVKFSTNGTFIDADCARRLAMIDRLDIQVSLDGLDAATNDAVRGEGSHAAALAALRQLGDAGVESFQISVVATRHNVDHLDGFWELARSLGARLRVTRLRPSGRGIESWPALRPTTTQQRRLYDWLIAQGDEVLTGDSFFHLNAFGADTVPGLNLCGAGRVVCLIDPVGDVYACPFAIHDRFRAGSVLAPGGLTRVWRESAVFTELRRPSPSGTCAPCGSFDACQGGCPAAKFFTGHPLDGPDPECVAGDHADTPATSGTLPRPASDHSTRDESTTVPIVLGWR